MPWTPPTFTPGVVWQDSPNFSTPLDALNLNLEENAEATYAAQVGQSIVNYFAQATSPVQTPEWTPEFYGAGYGGSAGDDWGPAWTAAWAAAQNSNGSVIAKASTYGFRTTIQSPTVQAGGALAPIYGVPGRGTQLKKLADVTIMNVAGPTIGSGYDQGSMLYGLWFDGGNNASWTAPLVTFFAVVDHENHYLVFENNYGPAFTVRGCWDFRWNNCSVFFCGAADGINPACLLYSNAGDAGFSTNNQFFHQLRVEDCRTGYLWAVGASNTDQIMLIKLDQCKFEQTGSSPMWGPLIKLANVSDYFQDQVQMTTSGVPPVSGQTPPIDALFTITSDGGTGRISLGRIKAYFGSAGASSATNVRSLISVTGSVSGLSYDDIEVTFGDTNYPASVFLWNSVPAVYKLKRGTVRGADALPLDVGAPWNGSGPHYYSAYRKDLATHWATLNPILPEGALGYDEDAKQFLVGDGTTSWNSLETAIQTTGYRFTSGSSLTIGTKDRTIGYGGSGARALTIPTPNTVPAGTMLIVHDEAGNASTGNITVTPATGTIDGAANKIINTNFGSLQLYSDGNANWRVVSSR